MLDLIETIAEVGRLRPSAPHVQDVDIFKTYFKDGKLKKNELDIRDGNCTRRELLARFLLLNAVLDQGPDMEGVRELLCGTINHLYQKEIRILHKPILFFNELGIVIDKIDEVHETVKKLREKNWRERNNTTKSYNLFMDGTTQTLNYAVFRWGVPLAVVLALSQNNVDSAEPLLDYLESEEPGWRSSAEIMSQKIKDHKKYGMGKAIGDKAAHLFAKWFVYTFELTRKKDSAWGQYSYEVPFDSNAGRVLFRAGFFLHYASEKELTSHDVIRKGQGKGGKHYIRVTNIRGLGTEYTDEIDKDLYQEICTVHLKTHKRAPQKIEIQRIPLALLYKNKNFTVGELDDGLMYIGTHLCVNHDDTSCDACPLMNICEGNNKNKKLITDYRT
jgi:hypothetical protein